MATEAAGDFTQIWTEICERAWGDDAFKDRLKTVPDEVLREYGIEFPGVRFHVIENALYENRAVMHLVLPVPREDIGRIPELDDNLIDQLYAACI